MTRAETPTRIDLLPSVAQLESWAAALHHLEEQGTPGIAPRPVARSLAALPERYGDFFHARAGGDAA